MCDCAARRRSRLLVASDSVCHIIGNLFRSEEHLKDAEDNVRVCDKVMTHCILALHRRSTTSATYAQDEETH
jgi:hypothetical protein